MKSFAKLYLELDLRADERSRLQSLEAYFDELPESNRNEEASWAIFLLTEHKERSWKIPTLVSPADIRLWIEEHNLYPAWLIDVSYDASGDLSETLALLLASPNASDDVLVSSLIQNTIWPLREMAPAEQLQHVVSTLKTLDADNALLLIKLVSGGFRMKLPAQIIARALVSSFGAEYARAMHQLAEPYQPTPEAFLGLISRSVIDQPKLFFHQAEQQEVIHANALNLSEWHIEWKQQGILVQVMKHHNHVSIWTDKEELITNLFPALIVDIKKLPDDCVLEGYIVINRGEEIITLPEWQKKQPKKIEAITRVAFVAADLLELREESVRTVPFAQRRILLEELLQKAKTYGAMSITSTEHLAHQSFNELAAIHQSSRSASRHGLLLRKKSKRYGEQESTLHWKPEPLIIKAVLLYAEAGETYAKHFSLFTFGVWSDDETLVPIAKVPLKLPPDDMEQIYAFIHDNEIEKFGPVRTVTPELVFEIAFDNLRISSRHKAGFVLEEATVIYWLQEASSQSASSLNTLRAYWRQFLGQKDSHSNER